MVRAISLLACFGLACGLGACGSGAAVGTSGTVSGADAKVGDGQAGLGDGWQAQQDALPPDDSWAWNFDTGAWQQGDTTTVPDGVNDGGSTQADALGDGSEGDAAPADASPADVEPPAPGQLGGKCVKHKDCKSKICANVDTEFGYCTSAGCSKSSDCTGIYSPDDPVCCVTYANQSYCLKQYQASQCGAQDKQPGDSCASGGQSDCKTVAGDWCFAQGEQAECVQACGKLDDTACPSGTACNVFPGGGGCLPFTPGVTDGAPCAGKAIGGCGKYAYCIGSNTGDPYAYCATGCKKDADCAAGLSCLIYQPGQGICQKHGDRKAGQNCADDRFSCDDKLFCIGWGGADAICSPACTVDGDCASVASAMGGSAYCAKASDSPVGACYPKGDKKNGESCGKDPLTCSKGSYCIGGYDQYDPDAYCQKACGAASDGICPAGSQCVKYSSNYSGCQVQGSKGQGEACDGAPTACKAGLICIGAKGKEICATLCTVGGAGCPPSVVGVGGTWCAAWGEGTAGVCMPSGSLDVGMSCKATPWACKPGSFCQQYGEAKDASCIAKCGAGGVCPKGTDCKDFGQAGDYCEPAGGKLQDENCSTDANSCAAGHVCVWKSTKYAICSKQCKTDGDCGPTGGVKGGLWCGVGKWGGYCLPDGPQAEFGPCYDKPFACGKGLLCIGDAASNPGAFCAKECTGFASVCGVASGGGGAKCEYLGGGQSWCFKTGKQPHGSLCLDDPQSCDPNTLCIKGTPQPTCLQECGTGKPACPGDSPCTYFPGSALKLCVPKDFKPFGAIRAPF